MSTETKIFVGKRQPAMETQATPKNVTSIGASGFVVGQKVTALRPGRRRVEARIVKLLGNGLATIRILRTGINELAQVANLKAVRGRRPGPQTPKNSATPSPKTSSSIEDLQCLIDVLESENGDLEARVDTLEKRLDQIAPLAEDVRAAWRVANRLPPSEPGLPSFE